MLKLKPCPFCGGKDIRYSTKVNRIRGKLQYHASFYCNSCHCYGKRVLSQHVEPCDYNSRRDMENSIILKNQAMIAWNTRYELTKVSLSLFTVVESPMSCGEYDYILVEDTEDAREVLCHLGATETDIEDMAEDNGKCLEIWHWMKEKGLEVSE